MAGLWASVVRQVNSERDAAIGAVERTNENLVFAHAAHVTLSVEKFDQLLRVIRELALREGKPFDLERDLSAIGVERRFVITFGIVDENGNHLQRVPAGPGFNVADREYFTWHQSHPHDALFFGKPILGRSSQAWGVTLSLRRFKADGSFDGVVYLHINPAVFTQLYEQSDLGENGAMALIGQDGITRARRNANRVSFGEDVSGSRLFDEWPKRKAGTYIGVAASDGQRRIASFRQIDPYPLIAVVAIGYEEALEPVEERARGYYAAATLGTALLLLLVALSWLRQQADERVMRRLGSSEARYRLLYERNLDGVLLARAADGVIIDANPAAQAILGLGDAEVGTRRLPDLLQVDGALLDALQGAADAGLHTRARARRADDTLVDVELATRGYVNERGERVIYVVFRDITERKRWEAEQQRLREDAEAASRAKDVAERANRAKSDFMSRVSHELRTPLNAILGFSQLLSLDSANGLRPNQRTQVGQIQRAGEHLLALIDDLLDISRLEAGALRVKLEPMDLVDVAHQVVNECALLAANRQIALHVESLRARCMVMADRTRVHQVVTNLVSNAIKYGRTGGQVTLQVRCGGATGTLAVIDNGLGISRENLAKLFVPFERIGREALGIEGTGIGLVISRRLVELMGGALDVQSAEGVGSTFTLSLPVAADDAPLRAAAAPAPAPALRRATLLYVDDDPANRLLMQGLTSLQPQLTLVLAGDGREGLARALAEVPDALLIDIRLPDMSGIELVQAVRAQPALRDIPAIAVSADAMPDEVAAALQAGFDGYVTKPVAAPALFAELARVLGR